MKKNQTILSPLSFALEFVIYVVAIIFIYRNSQLTNLVRLYFPFGIKGWVVMLGSLVVVSYVLLVMRIKFDKLALGSKLSTIEFVTHILVTMSALVLWWLESVLYENFVFGNFGIFLIYLLVYTGTLLPKILLFIIFANAGYTLMPMRQLRVPITHLSNSSLFINLPKKLRNWSSIWPIAGMVGLLVMAMVLNIAALSRWLIQEYGLVIKNIQISADERYELGLTELHNEIAFVAAHTPENAVIIHPTQSDDFPVIGNQVLIRYHLYPRVLVSWARLEQYKTDNSASHIAYTIMARGNKERGAKIFPTDRISADEIQILSTTGEVVTLKNIQVTPEWIANIENLAIGVIKHTL